MVLNARLATGLFSFQIPLFEFDPALVIKGNLPPAPVINIFIAPLTTNTCFRRKLTNWIYHCNLSNIIGLDSR